MAIIFTREPSQIPSVKNSDDAILFRYAVNNQNGYIQSRGLECSYTVNGSNFNINSGEVVIQGYDIVIDSNGASVSIDNVATRRYFSIYLELNLSIQTISIKSLYDTAGYPQLQASDNLTANTAGVARLELYRFEAINGVISNVFKIIVPIEYPEDVYMKNPILLKSGINAVSFNLNTIKNIEKINYVSVVISNDDNRVIMSNYLPYRDEIFVENILKPHTSGLLLWDTDSTNPNFSSRLTFTNGVVKLNKSERLSHSTFKIQSIYGY